jgi:ABC-2 type transport system permease protein
MLDALAAEALKFSRHRATWFLVWIYPIAFILLSLIAVVAGLSQHAPKGLVPQPSAERWIEHAAAIWVVPASTFGRYLISAFTAVVFAGEYGWNTWKLVVPHRSRGALIASKYGIVLALLYAAFLLTALLMLGSGWMEDLATGTPTPDGVTAAALLRAHGEGIAASLAPILITVAYTSLAAVLTRSMVAALAIGIAVTTLEGLIVNFGPFAALYAPGLVRAVYATLPGYHLANLAQWTSEGRGLHVPFLGTAPIALGWPVSAAAAAAWIGALAALTAATFRRQDLN